ncbi:MAG: IclR family transcriptional regulator [Syntrophorhabdaceae bacterium]|nr:IclR family transcriptional regulator [Syntrophorhabdaceae bacterium]
MIVKSADRVFQILETVGSRQDGITHGELSHLLKIPKGSLTYLLSNLLERGYLTFDRQKKNYMLGPKLLSLTGRYLSNIDIVKVGRSVIRRLVMEINEDTELTIMKDKEILFLYKEECTQPLKYSIPIGERAPLYATSAGKAILAFLPEEELMEYMSSVRLDPITPNTITDRKRLLDELCIIRERGVAYGIEEYHQGISAIASPVFNLFGDVVGAVVVTLPSIRFNPSKREIIEPRLLDAAKTISRKLGFEEENLKSINDSTKIT